MKSKIPDLSLTAIIGIMLCLICTALVCHIPVGEKVEAMQATEESTTRPAIHSDASSYPRPKQITMHVETTTEEITQVTKPATTKSSNTKPSTTKPVTTQPVTEPEPVVIRDGWYYNMSDDDVELFAKLVYLESGGTSLDCQKAVASVVLNRMTTQNASLHSVIYAKGQFSVAPRVASAKYSETSKQAVLYVLQYGPTIPQYVTYFRAGHYFNWGDRYCNYINIDNVYFSYSVDLKNSLS